MFNKNLETKYEEFNAKLIAMDQDLQDLQTSSKSGFSTDSKSKFAIKPQEITKKPKILKL